MMSETRKQKRMYEKYLKKVDPIKYEDWKSKKLDRIIEQRSHREKEALEKEAEK